VHATTGWAAEALQNADDLAAVTGATFYQTSVKGYQRLCLQANVRPWQVASELLSDASMQSSEKG
jgi:hypothetical protein